MKLALIRFPQASIGLYFVLMLPLIIDGVRQHFWDRTSANLIRLVTGIFFGYACVGLIIYFLKDGFLRGYRFGRELFFS